MAAIAITPGGADYTWTRAVQVLLGFMRAAAYDALRLRFFHGIHIYLLVIGRASATGSFTAGALPATLRFQMQYNAKPLQRPAHPSRITQEIPCPA